MPRVCAKSRGQAKLGCILSSTQSYCTNSNNRIRTDVKTKLAHAERSDPERNGWALGGRVLDSCTRENDEDCENKDAKLADILNGRIERCAAVARSRESDRPGLATAKSDFQTYMTIQCFVDGLAVNPMPGTASKVFARSWALDRTSTLPAQWRSRSGSVRSSTCNPYRRRNPCRR